MKEDKLKEIAKQNAVYSVVGNDPYARGQYEDGFMDGARWHESLPLSDRLSNSERDEIYKAYVFATKNIDYYSSNPTKSELFKGQRMILESLFGKDLFTKSE